MRTFLCVFKKTRELFSGERFSRIPGQETSLVLPRWQEGEGDRGWRFRPMSNCGCTATLCTYLHGPHLRSRAKVEAYSPSPNCDSLLNNGQQVYFLTLWQCGFRHISLVLVKRGTVFSVGLPDVIYNASQLREFGLYTTPHRNFEDFHLLVQKPGLVF